MAVTRNEYFLFRDYSKALKEWLMDKCYLINHDKDENVTVVFSTPDRAWAKYIYPTLNGGTLSPNINFDLTDASVKEGELLLGFVKSRYTNEKGELEMVPPPLIYELVYTATIYTRIRSEMDILLYQIVSNAQKNRKGVMVVNNQWAEVQAGNPRSEVESEGGEGSDKVMKYSIDLTIPRAYLPTEPYKVPGGIINSVEIDEEFVDGEI